MGDCANDLHVGRTRGVTVTLDLGLTVEAFAVGTLRERHPHALDRAYQEDYPDRAPPAD